MRIRRTSQNPPKSRGIPQRINKPVGHLLPDVRNRNKKNQLGDKENHPIMILMAAPADWLSLQIAHLAQTKSDNEFSRQPPSICVGWMDGWSLHNISIYHRCPSTLYHRVRARVRPTLYLTSHVCFLFHFSNWNW